MAAIRSNLRLAPVRAGTRRPPARQRASGGATQVRTLGPPSVVTAAAPAPEDLLALQRHAGNRAVTALLARQPAGASPPLAPGTLAAQAATPADPLDDPLDDPRIAWVQTLSRPKQETIDSLGPRVNTQYRRIEQRLAKARSDASEQRLTERREQLDRRYHDERVKNRHAVLAYFECTLGGADATRKFFTDDLVSFMRDDLIVHKTVAQRLELVRQELEDAGLPMPDTTVGQSLRGDHTRNKRERNSPGMLAHAMGYAIDWHAFRNPHIKDPRIQALIEGVTGERSRMELPAWRQRRAMIKAMGRGQADPARQQAFLDKVGSEFDRLAAASAALRGSLPQDAKAELAAMHGEVRPLLVAAARASTALARATRRRRISAEKLATYQEADAEAKRQLAAKHAEVRPKLERIFAGWRARIARRVAAIEQEAAAIGVDIRQVQPEDWLRPLRQEVRANRRKQRSPRRRINRVQRQARGPVRAVVQVLARIDSFERYLAAGATGAAQGAAPQAADLATVKDAAEETLTLARQLRADALAALGKPQPAAPRRPTHRPRRYSDRQVRRWLRDVVRHDATVRALRTRFDAADGSLLALVTAGNAAAGTLAEYERRNAEAKAKAQQHGAGGWRELQRRRKRLTYMEKAAGGLLDDLAFVFQETRVGDPGVTQLAGATGVAKTKGGGFFGPNPQPATEAEKARAKRLAGAGQMSREFGFGKLFYQAMARHGFDLGAAWDNSQDTMHFELVEGVESIKDPDSCDVQPAAGT